MKRIFSIALFSIWSAACWSGQMADDIIGSPMTDAFNRLRISNPETIFESVFEYDTLPFLWQTITNLGTESVTHVGRESSLYLTLPTHSTAKITRRTYEYIRYQPGKSQLIKLTGVFGDEKTGVRKRVGLFDDADGVFFEQTSDGWYAVLRSSVTGVTNDTRVARTSWNINKLSGVDLGKSIIFGLQLQWLGVGRVSYIVSIQGRLIPVHVIDNSSINTNTYMRTANLPLTYEIENTAGTDSATTIKQICSEVESEGGQQQIRGIQRSVSTAAAGVSVAYARRVLIGIRPSLALGTKTNRARITIRDIQASASSAPALLEVIYKPTSVGASVMTNSIGAINYDISGTNIVGGTVIDAFQVSATPSSRGGAVRALDSSKYPLTLDYAGLNPAEMYVVATAISGTPVVTATVNFTEEY